jgi:ubiquinone biosynthesis protein COQ9
LVLFLQKKNRFLPFARAPSYIVPMTDDEFDAGLVSAAFALGAAEGWRKVSAASAARSVGLDLVRARLRFPTRGTILKGFGGLADAHALTGAMQDGSVKDRLFDLLLRRFDFLQSHRAGVVALLRYAPLEPVLGAWLARETLKSMGWLLEAAGVSSHGIRGELRKRGLAAVWVWGIRAWLRDESEDLSATMAAVDVALSRADQVAARFNRTGSGSDGFVPETEVAAGEPPIDVEGDDLDTPPAVPGV